jgi:peptidoglycan/LPS O-acetylase OafA/YrhL
MHGGGTVSGLAKSLAFRPLISVGIALSIELAVRSAPVILNLPIVRAIGVMSYSIYLWQQPFTLEREHRFAPNPFFDITIRLVAVGICATGSYWLVEQPFLNLLKKFFAVH